MICHVGRSTDRAHGSLRPLAASLFCVNSSGVPCTFHWRQSGMNIFLWPWSPPMLKTHAIIHTNLPHVIHLCYTFEKSTTLSKKNLKVKATWKYESPNNTYYVHSSLLFAFYFCFVFNLVQFTFVVRVVDMAFKYCFGDQSVNFAAKAAAMCKYNHLW